MTNEEWVEQIHAQREVGKTAFNFGLAVGFCLGVALCVIVDTIIIKFF